MEGYTLSGIFTAFASAILGSFVYLKGKNLRLNRTFFLLCVSIVVWSIGIVISINSTDKNTALFWVRSGHFGSIFIPAFFLHFIFELLQLTGKKHNLYLCYSCSSLLGISNFTHLLVKDVVPKFNIKFYAVGGPLYPFFIFYFLIVIIYVHAILIINYKRSTGLKHNQLAYILLASLIGFIGGITSFLPVLHINIPPLGMYFVSIYAAIITYSIIKNRLLDIEFVLKKGAAYAYASLLLLIPLFLMVVFAQKLTFRSTSYPFSSFILLVIIVAAYFFPKVKLKAEKTVEQVIFKDKYDYRKTISDLSRAMVSILNLDEICKNLITSTTEAMMVDRASIFLLEEDKRVYTLCYSLGLDNGKVQHSYPVDDGFFQWAERHNEIFIREELERDQQKDELTAIIERMNEFESEICVPLITKKRLIGIINMGMKENKGMYTHEDLQLLTTLSNNATIAIENAQLYENLKKQKEFMARAERLASLGTLSAGLAHEIRNPLVAIKTFTQLLPDRFEDEEFRNHFLDVTAGEIDRISSLISELLEFARPSEPFFSQQDLNSILEKMVMFIAAEAKKKEQKISTQLGKQLPHITVDKEQIKQVFINILLNAIQATPEKGEISIQTRSVTKNGGAEFVQVEITDTGEGIPPDEVDKIFTPFYTTRNKGSGLGLAISHQIIKEHEGTIEVKSRPNQGTIFTINLPVNPLLYKGNRDSEKQG